MRTLACVMTMVAAFSASACRKKVAANPGVPPVATEAPSQPAEEPAQSTPAEQPVATAPDPGQTPQALSPGVAFSQELKRLLQDAYFDYDRHTLRGDGREALSRNGQVLASLFERFPSGTALIEGHADERGSSEYNLALSDRRATAAREYLTILGVPVDRFTVVGYGKERPQCTDHDEDCWQRNRRVHFAGK